MTDPRSGYLIGEVAERVSLSLRTVRYYEESGLLTPLRTAGGFRVFDDVALERLAVIKRMKPLGFTLEEMRVLLDLRDGLSETSSPAERATSLEGLETWQLLAQKKLAALQEQVQVAEQFLAGLRADTAKWLGASTDERQA